MADVRKVGERSRVPCAGGGGDCSGDDTSQLRGAGYRQQENGSYFCGNNVLNTQNIIVKKKYGRKEGVWGVFVVVVRGGGGGCGGDVIDGGDDAGGRGNGGPGDGGVRNCPSLRKWGTTWITIYIP